MKKLRLFFGLLLLFTTSSFAQLSFESNFNLVHIGRNQNILAKYQWNKFSVLAGIKYNFNKEISFPSGQRHFFKKSFWALDFKEHIGLEFGAQFVLLKKTNVELFTFYQAQITKSHIRHESYYALFPLVPYPQPESDYAYTLSKNFIGPVWALENNFGIGVNVNFTDFLYLSTKLGGGLVFYNNTDPNNFIGSEMWELSELFSMGMGWNF
ncbi:hypothetical protein [Brumimicrobium oceani]|uniref:DUF3575 domain-containing protein n=1 Tax=Brumimicrobium oceani TaxID=2100725 RepID=A0A2U2XHF7_9FLAO|nr:hypothetical protein [Brumimicrobium oceani]PWH87225.1 hypothetical protein DIT68_02880 [Brumimicrobium oceani]